MQKFENIETWVKKKHGSQARAAQALGTTQGVISQWITGRNCPSEEYQAKMRKMGYDGPWPKDGSNTGDTVSEESPPYIRDYNPGEYAAEAFLIVAEAARAGGAPLDSLEPKAVAEVIGSIADAVAQGRGEEARLRLVRKAETILQAMKR